MATKLEDAEGEIGSLQRTLDEQSSKMEYLLKTRAGGTKLEFQEYRNRLKPKAAKKSGQPRTIVCRLKNGKQKEAVVRKARKEKSEGLFIFEVLAVAILEKRANQVKS